LVGWKAHQENQEMKAVILFVSEGGTTKELDEFKAKAQEAIDKAHLDIEVLVVANMKAIALKKDEWIVIK